MPTSVSAHVLITDTTQSHGAILHIIPDDDPIAGQESTLYFDTQARLLGGNENTSSLTITDQSGEQVVIATAIDGTLITAAYTFPAQGVYQLTFTVRSAGKTYTFEHSQRVSRGTVGSALDTPSYVWAEALGIVSTLGLTGLVLIIIRHRKRIAQQSTM